MKNTVNSTAPTPRTRVEAIVVAVVSVMVSFGCATDQSTPQLSAQETSRARILFLQCRACHAVAGEDVQNKLGPSLARVMGRTSGTAPDYDGYSKALKEAQIVWSPSTLDAWLENPAKLIPDNLMVFSGIDDDANRALLVRYVQRISVVPAQ